MSPSDITTMSPSDITIGIPTRGRPQMLREAIISLLSQTVRPTILVHDNCINGSARVVCTEFPDVIYMQHSKDIGAIRNFASLVEACDTTFFGWLQDDDLVFPSFVETMIQSLHSFPDTGCSLGFALQVHRPDRIDRQRTTVFGPPGTTGWTTGKVQYLPKNAMIPWALVRYTGFSPAAMYRRSALLTALKSTQNFEFGIFFERAIIASISANSNIAIVPSLCTHLRYHADSASNEFLKQSLSDGGEAYRKTRQTLEGFLNSLCSSDFALDEFRREMKLEPLDALREFWNESSESNNEFGIAVHNCIQDELRARDALPSVSDSECNQPTGTLALIKSTVREFTPPIAVKFARKLFAKQ